MTRVRVTKEEFARVANEVAGLHPQLSNWHLPDFITLEGELDCCAPYEHNEHLHAPKSECNCVQPTYHEDSCALVASKMESIDGCCLNEGKIGDYCNHSCHKRKERCPCGCGMDMFEDAYEAMHRDMRPSKEEKCNGPFTDCKDCPVHRPVKPKIELLENTVAPDCWDTHHVELFNKLNELIKRENDRTN